MLCSLSIKRYVSSAVFVPAENVDAKHFTSKILISIWQYFVLFLTTWHGGVYEDDSFLRYSAV
jgi:hypothetical protein